MAKHDKVTKIIPQNRLKRGYKVGDKVTHISLGEGIIESLEGFSSDDVMVLFTGRPKAYSMNVEYIQKLDR